jgi:methionine synthase II (cobalamin-independent)
MLAMPADVLTIENSRSDDEMVRALATYGYSRDVGPGVYDVVRTTHHHHIEASITHSVTTSSINQSITPSIPPSLHHSLACPYCFLTPPPPSPLPLKQHSPVVPSVEFMANKARAYLKSGVLKGDATRIWINPDCGLKTRRWEEVRRSHHTHQSTPTH